MGSVIPEDLDFESPDVKLLLDSLPERRRSMFITMAKDPDVRMISNVFNQGMGNYWESVLTAKDKGKKVVFIPFNFSPEIFYALDMVPVGVEILDTMTMTLEEGIHPYLDLSVETGTAGDHVLGPKGGGRHAGSRCFGKTGFIGQRRFGRL